MTNTVQHSGATRCEIELRTGVDTVRLSIVDDESGGTAGTVGATGERPGGPREHGATRRGGGTGLAGLTERLAAAGGTLDFGPDGRRGFRLTAVLPVDLLAPPPGFEVAAGSGADGTTRQ